MSDPVVNLESLVRTLRGPLSFLRPEATELLRLVPDLVENLPRPQKIFLKDEAATPYVGFPVLQSQALRELRSALVGALRAEEDAQIRILRRESHDAASTQGAWELYLDRLTRMTENVTTSSYGRNFPDVFWLLHSLDVARHLKETPRRVARLDSSLGRSHGGDLKYRVFYKFVDRIFTVTYDAAQRLAAETEETEDELFPSLLTRMRDNVLVFTEDHISPDLGELGTYLDANLGIDGRDFRYRLVKLSEWHAKLLANEASFLSAVRHFAGVDPTRDPRALFKVPGYVGYLASRPDYDARRHLDKTGVQVWERLLAKLKEYELFHGLRRLVVLLDQTEDGRLSFEERSLSRTWVGPSTRQVSTATRPMDFGASWVVDPSVSRYGLIYDVTDFSQIVSVLRRSGTAAQDRSFRMMFRFQRRVNRAARAYRLTLEKYLGDGAFFSGRTAWRMLVVAIHVQRFYDQALREGFPFDRGMRIALNFGQYRLLPIEGAAAGAPDRYEFFGHGVVELARLASGKSMREIEEIKILLVNMGYPSETVHRFFAPLVERGQDVVDKAEEHRRFYAYINRNGKLVNEGIVATEEFVTHLGDEGGGKKLCHYEDGSRGYVVGSAPGQEGPIRVGFRKLGIATLKGLDPLAIFEVVDAAEWPAERMSELETSDLVLELEKSYARAVSRP